MNKSNEKDVPSMSILQSFDNIKNDEEVFSALKELEQYRIKKEKTYAISKNEEYDDIATSSLGYLIIDYSIAELYGKLRDNRVQALELSQSHYISFLNEMARLRFINKQYITDMVNGISETPEQARNTRIERFKESQQAKNILKNIETKKKQERDGLDEEDEREYWKALLRVYILNSIDNFGYQKREVTMLKEINKLKASGDFEKRKEKEDQEAERRRGGFKTFTIPKQPTVQDLQQLQTFAAQNQEYFTTQSNNNNDIVKGFTYKPEKLEIMQNVFNPRFKYGRMMTDEDWEAEKRDEMLEPVEEPDHTSADDDSNDDDEKLKEKREWDEFKDAHPRGSGNTLNMG
ncbi:hypothetical protein, conserved [Entamoeba dispar SAW760]|uniref:Uncharacterized protein n=1 Tax=Entamoeba dispar (strain ATCC PRA-260 / SAW760) TaxID=370354 RepID=B0EPU8_ENTDS|nr:uncharacterized protein EDI_026490 [Entamoeba dispar SAW760]EDR23417.1 hypothetical protein, conserved [Entamoeba dispar SAW760]|eukprot:EDR23417.1 hypothetical protein, conserved [Entamoeba dispar SAW760]